MLDNTERKLRELAHFFQQMKVSDSIDVLEGHFSAFISAGRSVTFSLQSDLKKFEGFSEWYSDKQKEMKDDELLRFFKDLRDSDIHTGKQNIESSIFIKGPVNSKNWKNRPEGSSIRITGRGVFFVENPDTPFEKVTPAEIPNTKVHKFGFRNPPSRHNNKNLSSQEPIYLCELYKKYLEDLVKEAKMTFWGKGAN